MPPLAPALTALAAGFGLDFCLEPPLDPFLGPPLDPAAVAGFGETLAAGLTDPLVTFLADCLVDGLAGVACSARSIAWATSEMAAMPSTVLSEPCQR